MALGTLVKRVVVLALFITGCVFILISDTHVALRVPDPYNALRQDHFLSSPSTTNLALDGSWKAGLQLEEFNDIQHARLAACKTRGHCPLKQKKLIILAWSQFAATLKGATAGENVWCDAIMYVLHALGYTMLIPANTSELMEMYHEYHDHIEMILWQDTPGNSRDYLKDPTCIYTDTSSLSQSPPPNATHVNISIWKIFHMHWTKSSAIGLGAPFTFSPEDFHKWPGITDGKKNTYLGYSIENTCLHAPEFPFNRRPRQAYVLAESVQQFIRKDYPLRAESGVVGDPISSTFYQNLSREADLTFVTHLDTPSSNTQPPPPGIIELPQMPRPELQKILSQSRVVVGLGSPRMSPDPWEALCLGIPFINPVRRWNRNDPEDRTRWESQHDALIHYRLDEPYVYHVKIGDEEGLKNAILKAMETPIDRFIPPNMKMGALVHRIRSILQTDWKAVAHEQMTTRGLQLGF